MEELLVRIETLQDVCKLVQEELALLKQDVKAAMPEPAYPLAEAMVESVSAAPPKSARRCRRGRGLKSLEGMQTLELHV